jgi:hypothetical protein
MRRALRTFSILAFLTLLPHGVHHFFPSVAGLDACKMVGKAIRKQDALANLDAVESVITALGAPGQDRCIPLQIQRSPAAPVEASSIAEKEVYAAINTCRAKRIRGELPGYAASAQCAASHLLEALEKANYPHMDLIVLFNSRRIALFFEQVDRNEVDQGYVAREQSRLVRELISAEHLPNNAVDQDPLSLRRIALGISPPFSGRDHVCIAYELRPECAYDRRRSNATTNVASNYVDASKGPFFLDWDPARRYCFVAKEKPSDRTITGGGPFQTFGSAIAATQSVKGCK